MIVEDGRTLFKMDEPLTDEDENPVVQFIAQQAGISLRKKDWERLQHFIECRLAHLGLLSLDEYCDRLRASHHPIQVSHQHQLDEEWTLLMQEVTNGESYFFRDPKQLSLICDRLLPKIIAKRQHAFEQGFLQRPYLNIWSAGCSTGEEPHSLAMLIQEKYPSLQDWQLNLIATDINPQAIAQAKAGLYRSWSLRQTPHHYRTQYFQAIGADWQITPTLTSSIQWDILNLKDSQAIATRIPWASMDIILCRNVFIYFDRATIRGILQQFHNGLNAEGYLIVGHAELEGQDLSEFQADHELGSIVYQPIRASDQRPKTIDPVPNLTETIVPPSIPDNRPVHPAHSDSVNWKEIEQLFQGHYFNTLKATLQNLPVTEQKDFRYLWVQARIAFQQKNLKQAQKFTQRAIKIKPQFIPALILLINIFQEQSQWDDALISSRKVICLDPANIIAHLKLVDIYEALGKKTKAQKSLTFLETIIEPLSNKIHLNDPIYRNVANVRSYIAWKKIKHPFYRPGPA
ncbi:MAG: hypothetical protein HC810_00545 [Acaryochloridaceae cyanobacterium RL_2_7]|nr:hypothetical protein [Acaryochloridaceae cyanobacterium RL_2_7]